MASCLHSLKQLLGTGSCCSVFALNGACGQQTRGSRSLAPQASRHRPADKLCSGRQQPKHQSSSREPEPALLRLAFKEAGLTRDSSLLRLGVKARTRIVPVCYPEAGQEPEEKTKVPAQELASFGTPLGPLTFGPRNPYKSKGPKPLYAKSKGCRSSHAPVRCKANEARFWAFQGNSLAFKVLSSGCSV